MIARLALAPFVIGPLVACASVGQTRDASDDLADAPPLRDVVASCPVAPPKPGAVCGVPASEVCSFGDPCRFDRYACERGRWVEIVEAGSTPTACPGAPPSTGSTCPSCGASFRCEYDAACESGVASTTSICSGGHWLTGMGTCSADGAANDDGGTE